jgi:Second Messenger Oligonucleotide or Dinucleotide Synthetase domain
MLSVDEAFEKFRGRLEITRTEEQDASRRQQRIRLQVQAGIGVQTDFLTGAYARETKTKPLKDVDIFVVLSDDEADYLDRPPTAVLEAVREILVPHYGVQRVSIAHHSVRVDFGVRVVDDLTDQVVSFDVVPAFADGDAFQIPDTRRHDWMTTDPRIHKARATEANKAFDEQWKPVVKMAKKSNQHHDKPVKPMFLLEVMALDLLHPPWGGSYPYELKEFFATAADRLNQGWADPAGLGPAVSDRLDTDPGAMRAAKDALRRAEAACTEALRLEHAGNTGPALATWQGLFGPLFAKS